MKVKHSKRWIETEQKMEQVALDLMKHSPLDKIAVRTICEAAKVNRTTFYAHFVDVYDLFDKLYLDMRKGIMERYVGQGAEVFTIRSFIPLFTHIKENRDFYKIVLKKSNSFPLRQGFESLLNDVIAPLCKNAGITDETEVLYYLVFFEAGFTMCLRRWVETGFKESEEELAKIIANCIPKIFLPQIIFSPDSPAQSTGLSKSPYE